jgi:hypothetical protein
MGPEDNPADDDPHAECAWEIGLYVKVMNWLQGNLFEQYVDRETKEIRYRITAHAHSMAKKLKGDSLFGAAMAAADGDEKHG